MAEGIVGETWRGLAPLSCQGESWDSAKVSPGGGVATETIGNNVKTLSPLPQFEKITISKLATPKTNIRNQHHRSRLRLNSRLLRGVRRTRAWLSGWSSQSSWRLAAPCSPWNSPRGANRCHGNPKDGISRCQYHTDIKCLCLQI